MPTKTRSGWVWNLRPFGHHCSKCEQTFDAETCPQCGNPSNDSANVRVDLDKSLNKYGILLLVGLLELLVAEFNYTPLDENPLMLSAFALWVTALVLTLFSIGQSDHFIALVRRILAIATPVLVLFCSFVILNGVLDHYPQVQAETHVVRTYFAGRYGREYHIDVSPSWRQGRNQETFEVHGNFYGNLRTGDLVRVEVHRGAFWIPWGPAVTKRMR